MLAKIILLIAGVFGHFQEAILGLNYTKTLSDALNSETLFKLGLLHFFGVDGAVQNFYVADLCFLASAAQKSVENLGFHLMLKHYKLDFINAMAEYLPLKNKRVYDVQFNNNFNSQLYSAASFGSVFSNARLGVQLAEEEDKCPPGVYYLLKALNFGEEGHPLDFPHRSMKEYSLEDLAVPMGVDLLQRFKDMNDHLDFKKGKDRIFGADGQLRNATSGLELLEKTCDEEECRIFICQVQTFVIGTPESMRKAFESIKNLARSSSPSIKAAALALLAYYYQHGFEVKQDSVKAEWLTARAMELKDPNALHGYASIKLENPDPAQFLMKYIKIQQYELESVRQNHSRALWREVLFYLSLPQGGMCDFAYSLLKTYFDKSVLTEMENLGLNQAVNKDFASSFGFYLIGAYFAKTNLQVSAISLISRLSQTTKHEKLLEALQFFNSHPSIFKLIESKITSFDKYYQEAFRIFRNELQSSRPSTKSFLKPAYRTLLDALIKKKNIVGTLLDLTDEASKKQPNYSAIHFKLKAYFISRNSTQSTIESYLKEFYDNEAHFQTARGLFKSSSDFTVSEIEEIEKYFELSLKNSPRKVLYFIEYVKFRLWYFKLKMKERFFKLGEPLLSLAAIVSITTLWFSLLHWIKTKFMHS